MTPKDAGLRYTSLVIPAFSLLKTVINGNYNPARSSPISAPESRTPFVIYDTPAGHSCHFDRYKYEPLPFPLKKKKIQKLNFDHAKRAERESMEAFPSESEITVADALLLLSESLCLLTPSFSTSSRCAISDESVGDCKISKDWIKSVEDLSPLSDCSNSKSCGSTLTSCDVGSTGESSSSTQADMLQALSLAARFHDLKLKVVKRSRTKHYTGKQIINKAVDPFSKWSTRTTKSTWSSSSAMSTSKRCLEMSPVTSSRSTTVDQGLKRLSVISNGSGGAREVNKKAKIVFGSPSMERRAEDILRLLSDGYWSSEVRIRNVLGDRADTSKALRM
ncbi:hypothetical protein Syun_017525 [Stephania yunnanensis]|uniref:HTH three-helical bundle domain-containing protein n=1 Tax=Stephania yunnanensis TaxID=152371 RepID=A0AAP0J769_9MAGN